MKLPRASREQKGRALNAEEIRKLLENCPDETHTIVATAVLAGLRRSELFGLRWADVDFEKHQINVK